jgi:lysophospholipase L1-like esterase
MPATRRQGRGIIIVLLLLCSLAANAFLIWLVREQYRETLRVRLDPTSATAFVPMNSALPALPVGQRRIVFVGDSRTEMWGQLPTVKDCQTVNRGKSHDTSGQLLLRLERDVIALKPDLVFLEVGANDLKSIGALPEDEQRIKNRLKENVHVVLDRLAANGIPVVISTVFPFGSVTLRRRPVWSDRIVVARDEWNEEIRAMNRPGVAIFDAERVLAMDGRLKPEFALDDLHLNGAGYDALNAALPPILEGAIRRAVP